MNNNEIWKDIKGFEGLYQVSNLGNVKALKRVSHGIAKITRKVFPRILAEHILKPQFDAVGYVHYRLTNAAGEIELWKRTSISRYGIFRIW